MLRQGHQVWIQEIHLRPSSFKAVALPWLVQSVRLLSRLVICFFLDAVRICPPWLDACFWECPYPSHCKPRTSQISWVCAVSCWDVTLYLQVGSLYPHFSPSRAHCLHMLYSETYLIRRDFRFYQLDWLAMCAWLLESRLTPSIHQNFCSLNLTDLNSLANQPTDFHLKEKSFAFAISGRVPLKTWL